MRRHATNGSATATAASVTTPSDERSDAVPLDRVPPASDGQSRRTIPREPRGPAPERRGRSSPSGGCAIKHPTADLVNGKVLFVKKCGACHTLAHANAQGTIGPEPRRRVPPGSRRRRQEHVDPGSGRLLDPLPEHAGRDAGRCSFRARTPRTWPPTSAHVAAIPGEDTGALATAVASVTQKPAERAERRRPDRRGSDRPAEVPGLERERHRGHGDDADAEQVLGDRTTSRSRATASARSADRLTTAASRRSNARASSPARYTFYCSVDGHEAAGMKGTLTVK